MCRAVIAPCTLNLTPTAAQHSQSAQTVSRPLCAAAQHTQSPQTVSRDSLHRQSPDYSVPLSELRTPTLLLSNSTQVTTLTELSMPASDQLLPGSNVCRVTTNNERGFLTRLGWTLGQNSDTRQACLLPNPYPF